MIYLHTKILIKNDHDLQLPLSGITNVYVADLMNTKMINIRDDTTGKTYDILTKYLFFAQSCKKNTILSLKLQVMIIDHQKKQRRYGLIGEEPGKNNNYRCLVFFTDDQTDISANYYSSSDVHICLDQTFECERETEKKGS